MLRFSGITGRLKDENIYKTPITSDRGNYYYNIYMMYYIETDCIPEHFEAYVDRVHVLKHFFENYLCTIWDVYVFFTLLSDSYIYFKKPEFVSKGFFLFLLFVPLYAIVIWSITIYHIFMVTAPHCFGVWITFSEDM